MKIRLVYNDKCKKSLIQNQIKIKQNGEHNLNYFQKNVMNVGPLPKPNLFLLRINSHNFHHFGIMKTYSFLYKKNLKIGILKIKFEISEVWNFILKKMSLKILEISLRMVFQNK